MISLEKSKEEITFNAFLRGIRIEKNISPSEEDICVKSSQVE